jgi:hypothetical protein
MAKESSYIKQASTHVAGLGNLNYQQLSLDS